jgi:hypothetical protein
MLFFWNKTFVSFPVITCDYSTYFIFYQFPKLYPVSLPLEPRTKRWRPSYLTQAQVVPHFESVTQLCKPLFHEICVIPLIRDSDFLRWTPPYKSHHSIKSYFEQVETILLPNLPKVQNWYIYFTS